jgi:DNA-binding NarL/FixJ family response regulator
MSEDPLTPWDITEAMLVKAFPSLSVRQCAVLYWIIRGKTDRVIAGFLDITRLTVSTHAKNIYAILCVENRVCAALEVFNVIICHQPPCAG